jgi:hypothetical protein
MNKPKKPIPTAIAISAITVAILVGAIPNLIIWNNIRSQKELTAASEEAGQQALDQLAAGGSTAAASDQPASVNTPSASALTPEQTFRQLVIAIFGSVIECPVNITNGLCADTPMSVDTAKLTLGTSDLWKQTDPWQNSVGAFVLPSGEVRYGGIGNYKGHTLFIYSDHP